MVGPAARAVSSSLPSMHSRAEYDLIVLDHPFMGAVAASGSLVPLDGIAGLSDASFVGPSLATYRMNDSLWALPIDAACQVAVSRPDLMRSLDARPPGNWSELVDLGALAKRKHLHLAIGLAGVHSLMTFFTLMANLGSPCATTQDEPFADRRARGEALALMRDLLSFCPPDVLDWNSIRLHDEMVARDDLVFCPAVYCYATYAEADQRKPLRFHDLPGPTGPSGSTIGGTGLAVSAHSKTHRRGARLRSVCCRAFHPGGVRRPSRPARAARGLARRCRQRTVRRLLSRHARHDRCLLDTGRATTDISPFRKRPASWSRPICAALSARARCSTAWSACTPASSPIPAGARASRPRS